MVRNSVLVELQCLSCIGDSVQSFFEYMQSLFEQKRHRDYVTMHDRFSEAVKPEWFLSPVGERIPELELMRLQSSLGDVEKSERYLESIFSRNFIDSIISHKSGHVVLDGALSDSARYAISQIAYLVSEHTSQDNQLKYLLLSVHTDHGNVEAWLRLLSGWLLTQSDKVRLVASIKWSNDHKAVHRALEQYLNGPGELMPDRWDRFGLQGKLRLAFLSGRTETVISLVNRIKSDEQALLAAPELTSVALYQQGDSVTLFALATKLLQQQPVGPEAFFVGGVYYLSIQRFDVARKFFSRAKGSAHGWIGYGLAFAMSDESGHAINAFRSATVAHPKCVFPFLYAGMECIRTNELKLAQSFLISALALCDGESTVNDTRVRALVLNEIGMICLKAEQFDIAAENMRLCCQLTDEIPKNFLSSMYANMGHALVKNRDMDGALKAFEIGLAHNRLNGNALAGLGYCHHCRGNLNRAIDLYSASLYQLTGNRKLENLVNNLIQLAVNEYSFSVKQSAIVPPTDEEALVLNAF
jgi:tetratricopeptide (TPR) repeat protein